MIATARSNTVSSISVEAICAHATIAAALSLATRVGLLQLLQKGWCSLCEISESTGLPELALDAVIGALASGEIIDVSGGGICQGRNYSDAYEQGAYARWFFEGYGPLLQHIPAGTAAFRNATAVAQAAAQYGARHVDPVVMSVLDQLHFTSVIDLGCGRGDRLWAIGARYNVPCVGIDSDPEVIALARDTARTGCAPPYIQFLRATAGCDVPLNVPRNADLMTCFFLGHDFWPKDSCVATLTQLRERFPLLKHFLFCDTYRVDRTGKDAPPPFIPAFLYVHGLLGQYIPTKEEWLQVFAESGWDCRNIVPVGIPDSAIFLLEPTVHCS